MFLLCSYNVECKNGTFYVKECFVMAASRLVTNSSASTKVDNQGNCWRETNHVLHGWLQRTTMCLPLNYMTLSTKVANVSERLPSRNIHNNRIMFLFFPLHKCCLMPCWTDVWAYVKACDDSHFIWKIQKRDGSGERSGAVSYTHLTLPTRRTV